MTQFSNAEISIAGWRDNTLLSNAFKLQQSGYLKPVANMQMVSWCVRWHRCMTVEECKMMQQFPVQQHPRTSEAAVSKTQQTSHIAPCRCLQVGHYRTKTASGRAHISITGKASMLIPIIIKILNTINKLIDGSICTSLIRILRVKNVSPVIIIVC